MSDDELNLLALLVERHGLREIIAALAVACDRRADEFAAAGVNRRERYWRQRGDFFRAFAALNRSTPFHL